MAYTKTRMARAELCRGQRTTARDLWDAAWRRGYSKSLALVSRWLRERRGQVKRGRHATRTADSTTDDTTPLKPHEPWTGRQWAHFLGTAWPRWATHALSQRLAQDPVYRKAWTLTRHFEMQRKAGNCDMGKQIMFRAIRDPRFITVRRGGILQAADHYLLAIWAADCAEHVLHFFEQTQPNDERPRRAIELSHAWARGEVTMTPARKAAFAAHLAAKEVSGAARESAHAAGQAVAVAHVAAHELGAAAYAIRAVRAAASEDERDEAGRRECRWQRVQLPDEIRERVLDDERVRNGKYWSLFDC